jgi:hypothetical protein
LSTVDYQQKRGSDKLIGHRTSCIVQSDDPDIAVDPVGATAVTWYDDDW